MFKKMAAMAFAGLLLFEATVSAAPQKRSPLDGQIFKACHVYDGSTVKLCNGTVIKLKDMKSPLPTEPYGKEAKAHLIWYIRKSLTHEVRLSQCQVQNKQNQCDMSLVTNDNDIEQNIRFEMLSTGLAQMTNGGCAACSELEGEARDKKLGIWKVAPASTPETHQQ